MQLFDKKVKHSLRRYIFQCLCASMTVAVALLLINATTKTTLIAVIGASAFIVFAAPNSFAARKRAILGGYAIGIIVGVLCSFLNNYIISIKPVLFETNIIFGAFAVGISIFLMVILDSEHPPAAGLSLAFLLNDWNGSDILHIVIIACFLALVKHSIGSRLKNLI